MSSSLPKRLIVGPEDDVRQMSLDDFDRASGRDGFVYELNKGVIEVTDVPDPSPNIGSSTPSRAR